MSDLPTLLRLEIYDSYLEHKKWAVFTEDGVKFCGDVWNPKTGELLYKIVEINDRYNQEALEAVFASEPYMPDELSEWDEYLKNDTV